jgi:diguanylate cyclase (GGDEF)-like protein/PAS domain S-box-containing protein
MDLSGRYISYRTASSDLLVAPPEHLVGYTVSGVMPPGEAGVVLGALQEAAAKGHSRGAQIRLEIEGRNYWFELSVASKKTNPDEDKRFIVLSRDITERKNAELEIEKLAFFDPLTLLPNRRFLLDRLQRGLASSERRGNNGAIFFVDLDNFKTLNDTQGHRLGDLLLVEVAKRLRHCVRLEDCIARLGGDEFVVLLEDLSTDLNEAAAEAESIGQKILDEIGKTYLLDGFEYHCSASVGVTLFSGRGDDVDELLKRADAAMYRSKAAGRNTLRFFDPAMQANLEARAVLEAELRRALPEQQLELFYQGQVDGSMRIIGAEVLLRWRHPVRGLIVPMQFIPLAEESGLIVPIGHWVLEAACDQLKRWDDSPQTRKLHLSVNVSARQFRQPDFVQRVKSIIHSSGIDPSRLILELTESLVLDNVVDSIEKMYSLKLLGVRFSMDDFGTGYSSLAYLKRLPLDQLKIDRSFVRDVDTDPGDAVIVRTIIDMARNFGLEVVAEGVENEAQQAFLLANDCTEFQGYLFSHPVPLPDFEALLTRHVSSNGSRHIVAS